MKKKLTADVSTLALEPLDTSSVGGRHLCQRSRFQSIQIPTSRLKKKCMMLCRVIKKIQKKLKQKCCEANIKKKMQKHRAWHLSGGLINDGRSLQQIANTFSILHRPTQCLRCWGFHVQTKEGKTVHIN
jgi:hypothetical protein